MLCKTRRGRGRGEIRATTLDRQHARNAATGALPCTAGASAATFLLPRGKTIKVRLGATGL
eukprot:10425511-Alexandrium_andersonii.AAC.1